MRARSDGDALVVWRCEDDHVHEEWAKYVSDTNGWLFFALRDPTEDQPAARLVAQHQVLRVDFPDITAETQDDATWSRDIPVLDKAEIEAGKLSPEMFEHTHNGTERSTHEPGPRLDDPPRG